MASKGSFNWVGIVGTIAALLGIVVPIAWNLYYARTGMSLIVLSTDELFSIESLGEQFRLEYVGDDDQPPVELASLSSVRFLVTNTGRSPIRSSDYEVPLAVDFSDCGGTIFLSKVVRSSPAKLGAVIRKIDGSSVDIEIPLLNESDSLEILLVGEGLKLSCLQVGGRVVGVKEILIEDRASQIPSASRSFGFGGWAIFATSALLTVFWIAGLYTSKNEKRALALLESTSIPDGDGGAEELERVLSEVQIIIDQASVSKRILSTTKASISSGKLELALNDALAIVRSELDTSKSLVKYFLPLSLVGWVYFSYLWFF